MFEEYRGRVCRVLHPGLGPAVTGIVQWVINAGADGKPSSYRVQAADGSMLDVAPDNIEMIGGDPVR